MGPKLARCPHRANCALLLAQAKQKKLRMTDPVMFTRGFSIGLVALLQAIMPSVIAVGMLVLLCHVYGTEFTDFFRVLALAVAVLSSLLPRGRTNGQTPVV